MRFAVEFLFVFQGRRKVASVRGEPKKSCEESHRKSLSLVRFANRSYFFARNRVF